MSDLPNSVGSAVTIDIDGKPWTFTALTIGDEADLEGELRILLADQLDVVGQARSLLADFDGRDRETLLREALREQLRLQRLGFVQLAAEFPLADVEAMILRRQLRTHHPEVTIDAIKRMPSLTTMKKIAAMMAHQLRDAYPKDFGAAFAAFMAATAPSTTATSGAGPAGA